MPTVESLAKDDLKILIDLYSRLHSLGYTSHAVSIAMKLADHSSIDPGLLPAHLYYCAKAEDSNPVALLTSFFILNQAINEEKIQRLLGLQALTLFERLGWTLKANLKTVFLLQLHPLNDCFFLTDSPNNASKPWNWVAPLNPIHYLLSRLTPLAKRGSMLDCYTGVGTLPVLASRAGLSAYGLEDNTRALDLSRLNAKLNQCNDISFQPTSVMPERAFDLISANVPLDLSPQSLKPGYAGTLVCEKSNADFLKTLSKRLTKDGTSSAFLYAVEYSDSSFLDRYAHWLGTETTWSVVALSYRSWTPITLALTYSAGAKPALYGTNFCSWLEAFEAISLKEVQGCCCFFFPSAYEWRLKRTLNDLTTSQATFIEKWLTSLRNFSCHLTTTYFINPEIASIYWNDSGHKAYLEWKQDYSWWEPKGVWVEGEAAQLLKKIQESPGDILYTQEKENSLTTLLSANLISASQEKK